MLLLLGLLVGADDRCVLLSFFLLKEDTTTIGWRTWIQRQEKRTMPMKPLGIPRGRNTRSECNAGGDTGGGTGGGTGGTVNDKTYASTMKIELPSIELPSI